ncbi:MAG: putative family peptidase [Candidatus Eremiobacteraeota bacterium]|nr:putative family peptidase [Candidatus Eremiobacteraeota bacterium]
MRGRLTWTLALAAFAAATMAARADARPWTLADVAATRTVSAVRLAPRADRIAYAITSVDPKTHADRTVWYLRSVGRADDAPLDVPPSAAPDDLQWSPAGEAIAWTDGGRLWRYDVASHRRRPLTGPARIALAFAWSPDGGRIAVTEQPAAARGAKAVSYFLDPLASGVAVTTPEPIGLWIVDVAAGTERPIGGTGSFGGEAAPAAPTWFPDGRRLAIGRQPSAYYADYERLRYVVVDTRDGGTTAIGGAYGVLPGSSPPAIDAAGRIAYVHTADGTTSGRTDVFVGDRNASAPLDRDFWSCGASRVTSAGSALYASALDGVAMRVYRLDGDAPRAITPADRTVLAFSVAANGRIAYVASAPDVLPEVFVADADGTHPTRVTHASSIPAGVDVAPTQLLRTATGDGHELVAQLTQPRGTQVPLVVELHGGPQCSDDIGFSPSAQWFATNGYALLRPNPRGSDGYGAWSYKAIVDDWGGGPLDDVRATIASARATGTIDATRMFVEGTSYGGYLTGWTVTHDDEFRAAVAGFPVVDLPMFSALSRSPGIVRRFFGSTPLATAAGRERLRAESPSSYADAMRTPLLVAAGLHDAQAPYPQAIAFYRALHEAGKDVQMLVYPDAGHGPSDTFGFVDYLAHIAGWFAAHGGLKIPGVILPPSAATGTASTGTVR